MISFFKHFLLFFVLFQDLNKVSLSQKSCSIKELDICLTNYFFEQKGIPTNDLQFEKLCQTSRQLEQCLWTYFKRCFSRLQNEMVKWISDPITKEFRERCETEKGNEKREEMFRFAPCLNSLSKEQQKCYQLLRNPLEYMFQSENQKRVPIGCCAARKTIHCFKQSIEEKCSVEHAQFATKFYPFEELISTICEGYKIGSKECELSEPPIDWKPSNKTKSVLSRVMSVYLGFN